MLSCEFAKINGCPDYVFVLLPPFFMRAFLPMSIFLTPSSLVDIHWEWMLSHILNVLRFLDSLCAEHCNLPFPTCSEVPGI